MEKLDCEKLISQVGRGTIDISMFNAPEDDNVPKISVWSFPDRGSWSTHKGDYPGNFSPYIPRYVMKLYSREGDLVLDPMVGSGTTLVEAKLLGRRAIGVDINIDALKVAASRVWYTHPEGCEGIEIYRGDVRKLDGIKDESIDLVITHPPYANIIKYSKESGDLSRLGPKRFLKAMEDVALEIYRVLKPGKYAAILIGDTRKSRHYVPLAYGLMRRFLHVGFVLKEDIIKVQHNMRGTITRWRGRYDFMLIAHEHLFVFYKPVSDEERKKLKLSGSDLI